jgi:hypothetical protein
VKYHEIWVKVLWEKKGVKFEIAKTPIVEAAGSRRSTRGHMSSDHELSDKTLQEKQSVGKLRFEIAEGQSPEVDDNH